MAIRGLTNNQLKIIAMVTMTLDHVGLALFPQCTALRVAGRLAFPIYAYMVAEGCTHTRKPVRYFGVMGLLALLCQIVYFVAMESLRQCILVTFTLSISLNLLIRRAKEKGGLLSWTVVALGTAAVYFICRTLPELLPRTDFDVDYGFIGAMTPVMIYLGRNKREKLLFTTLMLALLALESFSIQWYALVALPLLYLYNGSRGKWKMKWFFYLYYPAHLVLIQALVWIISVRIR